MRLGIGAPPRHLDVVGGIVLYRVVGGADGADLAEFGNAVAVRVQPDVRFAVGNLLVFLRECRVLEPADSVRASGDLLLRSCLAGTRVEVEHFLGNAQSQ